jgi:hypothetical protein
LFVKTSGRWQANSGLADHCEQCGSNSIQWFTPPRWDAVDGIFLCLACAKINVRFSLLQAAMLAAS